MPKRKSKAKRQSQSEAVPRGSSESERKINRLLSKIDRSKKPWAQTELSDDELEFLLEELTPIKRFENPTWKTVKNLRRQNQTIWRTFLYGMLISFVLERELSDLDDVWPEWKDEYFTKRFHKFIEMKRDGRIDYGYNKRRRNRIRTTVDPYFKWLEPHTTGEYAKAIAVNIKTIERYLKSIKAKPSTPVRGPYGQQYSSTVGLKIFKAWLTKPGWLTVGKLKKRFPVNNENDNITQPGEADLRCQLGVMLLERLYYDVGDEKLMEKFRSIIYDKLPGSKEAWLKQREHIKVRSNNFWDLPIKYQIYDMLPFSPIPPIN